MMLVMIGLLTSALIFNVEFQKRRERKKPTVLSMIGWRLTK